MPYSRLIQVGLTLNSIEESLKIIREMSPVSIIIMGHEFQNLEELVNLINRIKSIYKKDLGLKEPLIAVDQEGGNVARIRQIDYSPGNYALGFINNPNLTRYFGQRTGFELKKLGFHWDLAPVLDVLGNYENYIVMERSFSHEPEIVSIHGAQFIEGLQEYGIAATAKHFPGHGQVREDSHLDLPIDNRGFDSINNTIYPFRIAIQHGVKSIMMSHVLVAALDENMPVSLSKEWYRYIRKDLRFDGLIITDSLDMKAISKNFSAYEIAKYSYEAGADVLECVDINLAAEISENLFKIEGNNEERINRILGLYLNPSLNYEPPSEISKSISILLPQWKRRKLLNPENPISITNLLTSKYSDEFLEKIVRRLSELNIKVEKSSSKSNLSQRIYISKNLHINGKFKEINEECQDKDCVVIGTGIPVDYSTLNEKIGYIASMGEKYENILYSIFMVLGML